MTLIAGLELHETPTQLQTEVETVQLLANTVLGLRLSLNSSSADWSMVRFAAVVMKHSTIINKIGRKLKHGLSMISGMQ